jgi:NAD(P)H-dependent FMN reductase
MRTRVVAIVGSYQKGGTTDNAVEAVLQGAREKGAKTHTIYLTDQHIQFCTNCRECAQTPGPARGKCPQKDDMESILTEIEAADAVVLGSPVNYGNVTAIFRQFMERLTGFSYWPWGRGLATLRKPKPSRKAVLVTSSSMPEFLISWLTDAPSALRTTAKQLGARPVGTVFVGQSGSQPRCQLSDGDRERARLTGMKLI